MTDHFNSKEERKDLLTDHMLKLLWSGICADITIKADGQEWKAHSGILSARSSFFEAALKGPWQESTTGVIELKEEDAVVVDAMLQYIYSGTYHHTGKHPNKDSNTVEWVHRAVINGHIAIAGDKYGIPLLEKFARLRMIDNAESLKKSTNQSS